MSNSSLAHAPLHQICNDFFPIHGGSSKHSTCRDSNPLMVEDDMRDYSKMQTLAERLKLVREEKGWSKAQLMRAAGVKSSSTMSELENGNLVHSPQIPAIAAALGVSALWLQSGRGSKVATQQTVPEDPAIEALAYLDRTMPARAALFRAQIIAAKQEAEHLELERVAITEHQVELAKVRLMKQVAAQA